MGPVELALSERTCPMKAQQSHPGLAEINAPVGPQEVVCHTLNSQLMIG